MIKINSILPGKHECGSSVQRNLTVQEAAAYLKVSNSGIICGFLLEICVSKNFKVLFMFSCGFIVVTNI